MHTICDHQQICYSLWLLTINSHNDPVCMLKGSYINPTTISPTSSAILPDQWLNFDQTMVLACDQQWWGCENGPCPACDKLSLGTRLPTQRERRSLVPRLVLDCDWLLGNPAGNLNRRCLQLCSFSTTFRCQQSLLIWVTIFSWGTYTPPERGLDLVYWSILWVARLCWSQNEHRPGLEVILVWERGIERFLFSWICCLHTLN